MDETQELLLSMLEDLTSGGEEEREAFMALCVHSLNKLKKNDLVTPVFIFERLCNIIRPVSILHGIYTATSPMLSELPIQVCGYRTNEEVNVRRGLCASELSCIVMYNTHHPMVIALAKRSNEGTLLIRVWK